MYASAAAKDFPFMYLQIVSKKNIKVPLLISLICFTITNVMVDSITGIEKYIHVFNGTDFGIRQ